MKPPLARYLVAAFLFASATFLFGDDFKSVVIPGDGGVIPQPLPRVHGDQVMVIRNFTQESGMTRGVVTVSAPPNSTPAVKVLAAAILDKPALEVINSVVIAGPADVSVTCGATTGNCFISYKKDSN